MTNQELATALGIAKALVDHSHPRSTAIEYKLAVALIAVHHSCALLSTSAAVRGMREALEEIAK